MSLSISRSLFVELDAWQVSSLCSQRSISRQCFHCYVVKSVRLEILPWNCCCSWMSPYSRVTSSSRLNDASLHSDAAISTLYKWKLLHADIRFEGNKWREVLQKMEKCHSSIICLFFSRSIDKDSMKRRVTKDLRVKKKCVENGMFCYSLSTELTMIWAKRGDRCFPTGEAAQKRESGSVVVHRCFSLIHSSPTRNNLCTMRRAAANSLQKWNVCLAMMFSAGRKRRSAAQLAREAMFCAFFSDEMRAERMS